MATIRVEISNYYARNSGKTLCQHPSSVTARPRLDKLQEIEVTRSSTLEQDSCSTCLPKQAAKLVGMMLNKLIVFVSSAAFSMLATAQASTVNVSSQAEESLAASISSDYGHNSAMLHTAISNGPVKSSFTDGDTLILETSSDLGAMVLSLIHYWDFSNDSSIRAVRMQVTDSIANKSEHSSFGGLSDGETFVNPIPASFLLFLCGGAGLIGAVRKKALSVAR